MPFEFELISSFAGGILPLSLLYIPRQFLVLFPSDLSTAFLQGEHTLFGQKVLCIGTVLCTPLQGGAFGLRWYLHTVHSRWGKETCDALEQEHHLSA